MNLDLKAEQLSYNLTRPLIAAARTGTEENQQFVEDTGKMTEALSIRGVIDGKTQWDAIRAVAAAWWEDGVITATYTWSDATTTTFVGFVGNLSLGQQAGKVDEWDYNITIVIGEER